MIETVYTEQEWIKHYQKHKQKILKRYIKSRFIQVYNRIIDFVPYGCLIGLGIFAYYVCDFVTKWR